MMRGINFGPQSVNSSTMTLVTNESTKGIPQLRTFILHTHPSTMMVNEHMRPIGLKLRSVFNVLMVPFLLGFFSLDCDSTFARERESVSILRDLSIRPVSSPQNSYTADSFKFADVDGDGVDELIFHEYTREYPRNVLLKLAHLNAGELEIEWSATPELRSAAEERFLAGNVDNDAASELVVFSGQRLIRGTLYGTRILNWHKGELSTIGTDQLPAKAGALVDIDGDEVQEIVFAVVPKRLANWEGREPAILMICRVTPNGFETLHKLELPHAVRSLNSGDLNGDGIDEFFTEEISHDDSVSGQISIYEVDPDSGIRRVFVGNQLVKRVRFFRAFQSQGSTYLLIVRAGVERPLAIYKPLQLSDGSYQLLPQRAHSSKLIQDAVLSTMAYSRNTKHYVRRLNCTEEEVAQSGLRRCYKLEWIPEETYR